MYIINHIKYIVAMCETVNFRSEILLRLRRMRLGLPFCERQFDGSTD